LNVSADIALIQAKQEFNQSVGYVQTIVNQNYDNPISDIQFERSTCTYRSFSSVFSFGR